MTPRDYDRLMASHLAGVRRRNSALAEGAIGEGVVLLMLEEARLAFNALRQHIVYEARQIEEGDELP